MTGDERGGRTDDRRDAARQGELGQGGEKKDPDDPWGHRPGAELVGEGCGVLAQL